MPLLPLTQDGARHEVIDIMIAELRAASKQDALWIGYSIASKVMEQDLRWLKRRFSMFSDFLRDTPVYQEVLEEGRELGLEQGIEQGREMGREEGLQCLLALSDDDKKN